MKKEVLVKKIQDNASILEKISAISSVIALIMTVVFFVLLLFYALNLMNDREAFPKADIYGVLDYLSVFSTSIMVITVGLTLVLKVILSKLKEPQDMN